MTNQSQQDELLIDLETETLDDEPIPAGNQEPLSAGKAFPDFDITLPEGSLIPVASFTARGPAIINFIKGTWCPFCQTHMRNLMKWRASIPDKNVSLVTLSNESPAVIRSWLRKNPVNFTLASVPSPIFARLGIDIPKHEFARPATFVIEPGMMIRMSYVGPRGRELLKAKGKPQAWVFPRDPRDLKS